MKKHRVIIAGGRDFKNYFQLFYFCNHYLKNLDQKEIEIVSGTASGADKLGEKFAKENNYALKLFPADWDGKGKSAGHIRNEQMARYANYLIAFWDKRSRGTANMINTAKQRGLKVRVVNY